MTCTSGFAARVVKAGRLSMSMKGRSNGSQVAEMSKGSGMRKWVIYQGSGWSIEPRAQKPGIEA